MRMGRIVGLKLVCPRLVTRMWRAMNPMDPAELNLWLNDRNTKRGGIQADCMSMKDTELSQKKCLPNSFTTSLASCSHWSSWYPELRTSVIHKKPNSPLPMAWNGSK